MGQTDPNFDDEVSTISLGYFGILYIFRLIKLLTKKSELWNSFENLNLQSEYSYHINVSMDILTIIGNFFSRKVNELTTLQ